MRPISPALSTEVAFTIKRGHQIYTSYPGFMQEGSPVKNLPYDGLFFDIHGAMSVVGLDDPEGDLITRVRKVVGPETIISTSMDLHGNVSVGLSLGRRTA